MLGKDLEPRSDQEDQEGEDQRAQCKDCKAACMGGGHGPDPRVSLLDKVVAATKLLDVLETTL